MTERIMFSFGIMKFKMFAIITKQFKILNSIIIFNPIYMMNLLRRFKITTQVFFHNQMRTANISFAFTIRMFRLMYINISSTITNSTFPSRMVSTFIFSHTSKTKFFSISFGKFLSLTPRSFTQMRKPHFYFSFFRMFKSYFWHTFIIPLQSLMSSCIIPVS